MRMVGVTGFVVGNNNYTRGAAFERTVKAYLEFLGYYAVRAAGSHGLTDVIALKHDGIDREHHVLFIQCKTGKAKMTKAERLAFDELGKEFVATVLEVTPDNYKELLNGR